MKQILTELSTEDGSCIMDRERKQSRMLPLSTSKVKINFDNALKLTWRETKCLYSLIKNNNLKSHFQTSKNAT